MPATACSKNCCGLWSPRQAGRIDAGFPPALARQFRLALQVTKQIRYRRAIFGARMSGGTFLAEHTLFKVINNSCFSRRMNGD